MAEPDYRGYAAACVGALQRWYCSWTGQWRTTGWWNAANALTAVVGYTQRTGDHAHAHVPRRTFFAARLRHRDFIVHYFDDNGWWALAWISAYDLTGERRYLDAAEKIFAHNVTGWDDVCRGGVWWSDARAYKNAITNELFLTLAARLHQRVPAGRAVAGLTYLDWALREWEWFRGSGMIGANGLINDGLNAECQNNGGTCWTYNQGVILGGLAALCQITGDRAYLAQAESIAEAALRELTTAPPASPAGILTEHGEREMAAARSRGDRSQFKGIFVRNLFDLHQLAPRDAYRDFILGNAKSIWENDRNDADQFGLCWTGPFDTADASRQSSALDTLNAAAGLTAG